MKEEFRQKVKEELNKVVDVFYNKDLILEEQKEQKK